MKVTRIFAALALVAGFTGVAHAQCARLSWGTCDPWVENANFTVAGSYNLVESAFGVGEQNVGTDSNIHIGAFSGPVPDAWRFDDSGCQTGSQITLANKALSKACPVMLGPSSLAITNYFVGGSGEADLRLSVTYDTFTPSAATRYTLWQITFDHSFSNVGPTPPDKSSCGGAELCENLNLTFAQYLNTQNVLKNMGNCGDNDSFYPAGIFPSGFATWNGGCHPVATQAATWGRLKGLYH